MKMGILLCFSITNTISAAFAATDNLRSGLWEIVGHIPLTTEKEALQEFQSAGHLYHGDEWVRNLTPDEYKHYNTMGVAGNELVQQYLAQHNEAYMNLLPSQLGL